jgi:hypothetical protein
MERKSTARGARFAHCIFPRPAREGEILTQPSSAIFSAVGPNAPCIQIYVQHCIKEEGEKLAKLIMAHGAHIFVSGNAKDMPTDVRSAFRHVLMQHEGMAEGEAEKYLKVLWNDHFWALWSASCNDLLPFTLGNRGWKEINGTAWSAGHDQNLTCGPVCVCVIA